MKKKIVLIRDMIPDMEWILYRRDLAHEVDFMARATVADKIQHMGLSLIDAGQTILINTGMLNYLSKQPRAPLSPLPFPAIIFQLSEPVQAFAHLTQDSLQRMDGNQSTIAIVLGRHIGPDMKSMTDLFYAVVKTPGHPSIITFYENAWDAIDGRPKIDPKELLSINPAKANLLAERFTLARNLIYLINNQVDLKEHAAAAPHQKTTQKGKDSTPPRSYYTCILRPHRPTPEPNPEQAPTPHQPSGRQVGYEFDVIGHWRHYKNGKVVWIKNHRRGIDHGPYIPKVYTLSNTQKEVE